MSISKKQTVKQFNDEYEFFVEQEVTIDTTGSEAWIVIEHNGNDLSMSLDNWNELTKLAAQVILLT
jgi:hypothetical protein